MSLDLNNLYRFDEFVLDPANRSLVRAGLPISLSAKSCQVLTYLVANPGRVITKDELLKAVWPESFVEESNLPGYISGLRKALTDRAGYIATVPGLGYKFTAGVETEVPLELRSQPVDLELQQMRETTHVVIREHSAPVPHSPFWTGRRIAVAASVVAVVALAGWWLRPQPAPGQPRQIVVADFVNATQDPAFDNTLRSALEIVLAQSPFMDVMSERDGVKTVQLMGLSKNTLMTADVAREVCERTNREVLLTGSLASLGQRYLLTLEATDCVSGKHLASAKEEASSKENVLDALDRAAEKVRRGLHESEASLTTYKVPLRSETTSSLEALKAYSLGVYLYAQGELKTEGMADFRRAIELDPQFAMAYGELGVGNLYVGQTETAATCFKKAFELSGHVSPLEQLRIRAWYYALGQRNLIEGIKAYHLWELTYPDDPSPPINEVDAYMTLGQWDAALAAGERTRKRFPGYPVLHENLATIYRSLNRFEDAKTSSLTSSQVGKDAPSLHITLFLVAFAQQDKEAIAREGQWFDIHEDGATVWFYPSFRAEAAASAGSMKRAEALFESEHEAAGRANLPEAADRILTTQALTEFRLGFPDAARSTLARLRETDTISPESAIAQAQIGDISIADRFLASHNSPTPDTVMTYVYLPRLRAAIALRRGRPNDAIVALESAKPYEMCDYGVPALRGDAYLQTGQLDLAINEYRKIVDRPGIDPTSTLYPLAHLGLARSLAAQRNFSASAAAYQAFFTMWKDADPDLPVLQKARHEYTALNANDLQTESVSQLQNKPASLAR